MINVLIIEDDPMVREINEKFLGKVEGYNLQASVGSIEEAKEEITKGSVNLVLLDMFLSKGVGLDFLKWIRTNELNCDVILITADKSIETVESAFRFGAVDYIIKPFTFKRFKDALEQYKSRKVSFTEKKNAEQDIIDQVVFKENKDKVNVFEDIKDIRDVKGVSQHTYEKIINCIEKIGDKSITAKEIAELVGVSRITARRYLDILEKEGKVVLEMEYGKIGRPLNKYKFNNGYKFNNDYE
ncbi:response regulator [Clostridium sp. DL1XJH146]